MYQWKLSPNWLLSGLILLGIIPLYALPSSQIPIIWFFLLVVDTLIILVIADFYLRSSAFSLEFCFFIFVFQNILIGLFNPRGENLSYVAWLLGYSTLLPVFIILLNLFRGGGRKLSYFLPLHIISLLFTAYILFLFIISDAPFEARIPASRNAISIILLFYAGYLRPTFSKRDISSFDRFMPLLILAVVIFGYVELFIFDDYFWTERLNIDYVASAKNINPTIQSSAPVPSDFYTPIAQRYYRRMASIFATPITLGYFLAFAFLFILYATITIRRPPIKLMLKWIFLLAILGALFLSLSKGGWQVLGVGILFYIWLRKLPPKRFSHVLMITLLLGAVSSMIGIGLFWGKGTTLELHVQGLLSPLTSLRGTTMLIGNSLGSGGTISARLGVDIPFSSERGAENGIGTLLYQTGFIGVLLVLMIMILILRYLFYNLRKLKSDIKTSTFLLISLSATAGLVINAFYQENSFALIPASFFFITAGLALNRSLKPSGNQSGISEE